MNQALTVLIYVIAGFIILYALWLIVFLTFFRSVWKRASKDHANWSRTVRYSRKRR